MHPLDEDVHPNSLTGAFEKTLTTVHANIYRLISLQVIVNLWMTTTLVSQHHFLFSQIFSFQQMPSSPTAFSQGFSFWLIVLYFWLVSGTPEISLLNVSILIQWTLWQKLCEKTSLFCDKCEWHLLLPLIKNSNNILVNLLAPKQVYLTIYTSWLNQEQFGSPVFDSSLVPTQGRGCWCLDRRQVGN